MCWEVHLCVMLGHLGNGRFGCAEERGAQRLPPVSETKLYCISNTVCGNAIVVYASPAHSCGMIPTPFLANDSGRATRSNRT